MFRRMLNLLKSNSFFLFGPRGTGKTSLIRQLFNSKNTYWIDLLDPDQEEAFQINPKLLKHSIAALKQIPEWIVIDEIQKAPKLLDLVHQIIESEDSEYRKIKFALTGSSARKLKRGAANLLAGRAFTYNLYPLTHQELKESFDLKTVLAWGTLPLAVTLKEDREKKAFLDSYTKTYLKEEIIAEQLVRKVIPFRKFLPIAAQCNGTIINYEKIAKDLGVDWSTVKNYFEILEDTLLGFQLPSFSRSLRKQQIQSSKFYLFDTGVSRALSKTLSIPVNSGQTIGPLFEQFIICEAHRLNHYLDKDFTFSFLNTKGGLEIDLIIERPGRKTALVEIKSGDNIRKDHIKHVETICSESNDYEGFCFCQEEKVKKLGHVMVLPWKQGFEEVGLY